MSAPVPFELTVSGKAVVTHPAERAVINVKAVSTGPDKASAVDEATIAAKQVELLLRELSPQEQTAEAKAAAALAHWSKMSLSSTSWMPHDNDGKPDPPRQYKASVSFDIRFRNFEALGSFGTQISSMPHVEVYGIDWILTTDTERSYEPQLRRESAADAMQKAKEYCDVFACTNLRPVELTVSS